MSMLKYIVKTPLHAIRADVAEYKNLRAKVSDAKHKYDISRERLSAGLDGCLYTYISQVPDFGRDNDSGVCVSLERCEHFSYCGPCTRTQCKYYKNNVAFFDSSRMLHILKKQRNIYWIQKFANCR